MHLDEYIAFLQTHDTEDLLSTLIQESWYAYENESVLTNQKNSDYNYYYMLRAYGDRIASLAYAYDNLNGKFKVTRFDINHMLKLYLEIDESLTDNPFSKNRERDLPILDKSKVWKTFSTPQSYEKLCLLMSMNRMMRSQWGSVKAAGRGIQRSIGIMDFFYQEIPNPAEIQKRLKRSLSMSTMDVYRAAYSLLGVLANSASPGIFHSSLSLRIDEDASNYGITAHTINLIARRWSWDKNLLQNWLSQYTELRSLDQKYFPSPLIKNPLLKKITMNSDQESYIVPSPWCYVAKVIYHAEESVLECCANEEEAKGIPEALGEAFSLFEGNVFREICGPNSVVSLDKFDLHKALIADYILIEDDCALIIELKRSLCSTVEMSFSATTAFVDILDRSFSALKQIHSTFERKDTFDPRLKNISQIGYIVCCNQSLVQEGNIITSFYYNSKAKEHYNAPFIVLDIDELEQFLFNHGVKKLFYLIQEFGLNINQNINKQNFYLKDKSLTELSIYKEINRRILPID